MRGPVRVLGAMLAGAGGGLIVFGVWPLAIVLLMIGGIIIAITFTLPEPLPEDANEYARPAPEHLTPRYTAIPGEPAPQVYCNNCGIRIESQHVHCERCGSNTEKMVGGEAT